MPYAAELGAAMDQDFSNVQAHLGEGDEMADLGAKAAVQGEQVAFASAQPGKEVVAHELVHVAQTRTAGGADPQVCHVR